MLEVTKGRDKGQWWPLQAADQIVSASFVCPVCELRAYLTDHEIAEDGTVTPSVLCDCGFHDYLKLIGW